MKTNLKQQFLRTIVGGALIAGLIPVSSAFAALPAFPTSGSCAMLVTKPVPITATFPVSATYNIFAILNFTSATAGTIDYTPTTVTYTANGSQTATNGGGGLGVAFAVATPPAAPAGVKMISFTDPNGGGVIAANAIAVNGGNTILLQGTNDGFSGVCQF